MRSWQTWVKQKRWRIASLKEVWTAWYLMKSCLGEQITGKRCYSAYWELLHMSWRSLCSFSSGIISLRRKNVSCTKTRTCIHCPKCHCVFCLCLQALGHAAPSPEGSCGVAGCKLGPQGAVTQILSQGRIKPLCLVLSARWNRTNA